MAVDGMDMCAKLAHNQEYEDAPAARIGATRMALQVNSSINFICLG